MKALLAAFLFVLAALGAMTLQAAVTLQCLGSGVSAVLCTPEVRR